MVLYKTPIKNSFERKEWMGWGMGWGLGGWGLGGWEMGGLGDGGLLGIEIFCSTDVCKSVYGLASSCLLMTTSTVCNKLVACIEVLHINDSKKLN